MQICPPIRLALSSIFPAGFLPAFCRSGGRFDAVIAGVANQVRKRIGKLFQHAFIQLDFRSDHFQFDLFVHLPGQIADHARELGEQISHRLHAGPA